MGKNKLYKFNKKLFMACGSYGYEWTLEWGKKKNGYKVIGIYDIGMVYHILFRTPVYRSIFPKRSIPIYECNGSNEENCIGQCVRTHKDRLKKGI